MTSGQVQIIFGSGPIILIILDRVNILMACKSIRSKTLKAMAYLKNHRDFFFLSMSLKKSSSVIFQTKRLQIIVKRVLKECSCDVEKNKLMWDAYLFGL